MNVSPLFIFIIGVLMGFIIAMYVLGTATKDTTPQQTAANGQSLDELLRVQIAYQQSQNMMRSLQLDQARQEAELRMIEQERSKLLASTQRLNHADIRHVLQQFADRGDL